DHVAGDLTGNHHHWNRVHMGGSDTGNRVGCARTRRHHHHTGFAGGARVTISHVRGCLLVADQDMGYFLFLEQGVVDMQKSTTRVPVDIFDTFVAQEADDHFSAG